jgi:hypothetical protein
MNNDIKSETINLIKTKQYNPETLRKIKFGLMMLCSCGKAHHGKYDKCQQCMKRPCKDCGKGFIKGSKETCSSCMRKRTRKENQ